MGSRLTLILLFIGGLAACQPVMATDLFFSPDTATGNIGQTVLLSGQINASALMRGFTVYLSYDTNVINLAEPPVAGSLIANHQGLQFNYFDHAPFEPDVLEIGATIFGTDFWQGPGELFQARFTLRQCGIASLTTPYPPFFVAADETYPTVTFHPATAIICTITPANPQTLTIFSNTPTSVRLFWNAVTQDALGHPLPVAPAYRVYRQQMIPSPQPISQIATVADTFYTDSDFQDGECLYQVTAQTTP